MIRKSKKLLAIVMTIAILSTMFSGFSVLAVGRTTIANPGTITVSGTTTYTDTDFTVDSATNLFYLTGDNAKLILNNCTITYTVGGSADTLVGAAVAIKINSPFTGIAVTLNDTTITMQGGLSRGMSFAGAVAGTITLNNSKILFSTPANTNSTYSRGISTWQNADLALTISLLNSEISGCYYPINLSTVGASSGIYGITVNVNNSKLEGYCALNIWSWDNIINVTNGSELIGRNYYDDPANNDFNVISLYGTAVNNIINVTNSSVIAIATGTAKQYIIGEWNDGTANDITLGTGTKVYYCTGTLPYCNYNGDFNIGAVSDISDSAAAFNPMLEVGVGGQYATIAAAVAAANTGDTIGVFGTIDLNTSAGFSAFGSPAVAALIVDKNVTIMGVGSNPTITCSLVAGTANVTAIWMKQGEIKNLTIKRPAGDGPNLLIGGVYLQGTAKITNCTVKNFRTGVEARGNNEIVGNTIESNRTGFIYISTGSTTPVVKINNNTITDNRTFGILLNDGGTFGGPPNYPGNWYTGNWSFSIKGNEIYGNWFAEFETRNLNPIDITNNYWGSQGPVLIHDYVNERLHPADGGSAIQTKPGRPAGGIYQPTHSTSVTRPTTETYMNFTAGVLTLDIAAPVFTPEADITGIAVQAAENIVPATATLVVTPIAVTDTVMVDAIALAIQGEGSAAPVISAAYDISLNSAGVEVQPNGNITISLPIPQADLGKKIMVLHILDDGTVEIIPATIVDGKAVFVTNSLSDFVLITGSNVPVDFTTTSAIGKTGGNVTVDVNIAADSASGTGTIVLPFDPTKLEIVSAIAGPALENAVTADPGGAFIYSINTANIDATHSATTLAYVNENVGGFNAGGSVLRVTYKILSVNDAVISVAPTITELCDSSIPENNLGYTISYGEIRVDNTAPGLATLAPSTTAPTNQNVTVTITYPGDAAVKQFSYDNSNWSLYTGALSIPANCTVYAKGTDTAGNSSLVSNLVISNIDKTIPAAATLSPNIANATPTNTNVLVTITYPTNDAGDSFIKQYKIGSGAWTTYTNGTPVTVTANDTVYAQSRDEAGNWSSESSLEVTNIDKVAPVIEGVTAGLSNTDKNPTFSDAVNSCTATLNGSNYVSGTTISAGDWTLTATDAAGNTTTVIFEIDQTLPTVGVVENNGLYKVDKNPTFSDHNGATATLNNVSFTSGDPVSEGTWALVVTDTAGNVTTVNFRIDETKPTAAGLARSTSASTNSLTVGIEYPELDGLHEYSLDGTNWITYTGAVPITLAAAAVAPTVYRTVYARSTDLAGNTSDGSSVALPNLVMLGDVNLGDNVSVMDALMSLHAASGKTALTSDNARFAADVNKSSTVTALDSLKILQFCSNKINGDYLTAKQS